ncbi:MAG: hypothetical protein H6722_12225 [Sandaracinus sp.]|nr:hypothetical protein [Sandaracinus sp.]MCB9613212.1 hypothetical protein [Sandaracinus sp.]
MSDQNEPRRMIDDETVPEELRGWIRESARWEPAAVAFEVPSVTAASARSLPRGWRVLVGGISGVVLLAGLGAWLALGNEPAVEVAGAPRQSAPIEVHPQEQPVPRSVELPEPIPTEDPPVGDDDMRSTASSSPRETSSRSLSEPALLERARRLLASAPQRTLALARAHERRFPEGALIEERELLAIEALVGVGRVDEAERRARRFLRRWPDSVQARRVREVSSSLAPH